MSGIADLYYLLRFAAPQLIDGEFVFLSLPSGHAIEGLSPVCTFAEQEGLSFIVPRTQAERAGLGTGPAFRQITLKVNSSLEAVGFLAAVAGALAGAGIACNAVSAFHHDHLFVPSCRAEQAMDVLSRLGK